MIHRGLLSPNDERRMRCAVRFFYDLQGLRIAQNNRGKTKDGEEDERVKVELTDEDREFARLSAEGLNELEKQALKEVVRVASPHPMWKWLTAHKGIGPTLAGFILAEFNPHLAERPSSFWKFAGLAVEDGQADRRRKGQRLAYNSRIKSKLLEVLAGCLMKAKNEDYTPGYYEARQGREAQVGRCMACEGVGVILKKPASDAAPETIVAFAAKFEEAKELVRRFEAGKKLKASEKKRLCWNCQGAKEASWGRGDSHRHHDARRRMVKDFLADLWREWRTQCGLPVVPLYIYKDQNQTPHAHRGRYGEIDGVPYTGPAYPDKQGKWPAEYGWPDEEIPKEPPVSGPGSRDRFGRPWAWYEVESE